MAFEFNCVHCGYFLKTDDREIVEATQCPVCGNAIEPQVPVANEPPGLDAGFEPNQRDEIELPAAMPARRAASLEIDDVCSTSWSIFKSQLGLVLGAVWIHAVILSVVSTPTSIAQNMLQTDEHPQELHVVLVTVVIGGNILSLLLGAYMNGGLNLFLLRLIKGEGAEIMDIFRGGRYFGRMLLCTICYSIFVGFGFLACIIPGIVLSLMFAPYQLALVDRDPSDPLGALWQAKRVTDGHKLQLLVLVFVIGIINILGLLVLCVGYIFTVPLSALIWAVAYMRMTGQRTIADVG